MPKKTSKRRSSARRSSRRLRPNAPERIRLGDKVRYAGHEWDVDDIQAYDHARGGEPKTLVLRRTIVVDPKKRYLDESTSKRNVPASDVELLWSVRPNDSGSTESELKAARDTAWHRLERAKTKLASAPSVRHSEDYADEVKYAERDYKAACIAWRKSWGDESLLHPNGPDRYLLVRDLPRSLQAALREVEYGKKDIEVRARENFDPSAAGGGGRRGFVAACKMDDSGTYEIEWGSWGGENPFTKTVEGFRGEVPISPEIAFIRGSIGGGHPTNASVYVSPHAMNPALLTAGPEVTPKEAKILAIFKGLKSSYRPEYLDRLQEEEGIEGSRARKEATDLAIESLIARGFLSRNKAGSISITTEGRNAADTRQP